MVWPLYRYGELLAGARIVARTERKRIPQSRMRRSQLRVKSCSLWIHDRLFPLLQIYSLCKSNQGSARFSGFWGLRCSARSTYHTPVRRHDRSASPTDLQNIGSRRWIAPQHAFRLNLSTRQCGLGTSLAGKPVSNANPLPRATFNRSTPEDAENIGADRLLEHLPHLFDRESPDKFHSHIA